MSNPGSDFGRALLACAIDGTHPDEQPLRHVADLPPRPGRPQAWPQWADPDVALHKLGSFSEYKDTVSGSEFELVAPTQISLHGKVSPPAWSPSWTNGCSS